MMTLTGITALLGAGGIATGCALYFAAPSLLLAALEAIDNALKAMLTTRIGCALLAGGVMLLAGEIHASRRVKAECIADKAEMVKAAEVARQKRDAEIAAETAKQYTPEIDRLSKQAADLQKQAQNYERKLLANKAAGSACLLRSDALRLRPHAK